MYETFPQLIIQFLNNTFLNTWSPLAIFSMLFSIFNAINGLYRLFFYKYIKKVPLANIPVHFELFGVTLIHIDIDNPDDFNDYYDQSKAIVAAPDEDDNELDKQLFAGGELKDSGAFLEVEMVLRRKEKPGTKVSRHEFNMLKKIVLSLWRKVMMGSNEEDDEYDLALQSKNDEDKALPQTKKGACDLIDAPLFENEKDESRQDGEKARIVGD